MESNDIPIVLKPSAQPFAPHLCHAFMHANVSKVVVTEAQHRPFYLIKQNVREPKKCSQTHKLFVCSFTMQAKGLVAVFPGRKKMSVCGKFTHTDLDMERDVTWERKTIIEDYCCSTSDKLEM